jgi:hypothetical protein
MLFHYSSYEKDIETEDDLLKTYLPCAAPSINGYFELKNFYWFKEFFKKLLFLPFSSIDFFSV